MTEPTPIANILDADSCPRPTAILAALIDEPSLRSVSTVHLQRPALRAPGWIRTTAPTPLARRVGRMLCNAYGLEA